MNDKKIKQTFLPILAGLLIAYFLLYFYYEITDVIFYPEDGDQVFSADAFYLPIVLTTLVPLLLITGLFQFFIVIPIWEKYKQGKKIFRLKLWQLITYSSIIFGVLVAILIKHPFTSNESFAINISSAIIMTLAYWAANSQTLKFLDRKKSFS